MLDKSSTKLFVSGALMLFANAAGAFADDCAPKPVCPPKPCPPKPCCKPVCCPPIEDDCCKRNICPPTGMITPRVDLVKGDGMEWFVTSDYTYWTAREDSLEFAFTIVTQGAIPTQSAGQGKVYRINNKWASGFKVGLGTDFCHDGWDVYAEYTWFNSTTDKHIGGFAVDSTPLGAVSLVDGYWNVNGNFTQGNIAYTSSSAKWRVNMNVVDLEMGRNFYVSPRLTLRPFYGLKGAWNKQHMNVNFDGLDSAVPAPAPVPAELATTNKIKNWGVGVRGGMDASWHFTRSFSFIGDMAFTALWEQFKVTRYDTLAESGVVRSTIDLKEDLYVVKPIIEWMLGLKWETGLSCDTYHLAISAAWEEQVWFGQNKFLRVPGCAPTAGDDLTFQGLTVDVRFDF